MIRKAENRDIPGIMALLLQVNLVHHRGRPDLFKGPATKYGPQELQKILANEKTPVFVYTDENDRVMAHCFCILKQFENDPLMTDVKTLYSASGRRPSGMSKTMPGKQAATTSR